jgi:hypothetical protein
MMQMSDALIEERVVPASDLLPIGVLAHELGATPASYAQVEREIGEAAAKLNVFFSRIAGVVFVDVQSAQKIAVLVRVNRKAGFAKAPEPDPVETAAPNN